MHPHIRLPQKFITESELISGIQRAYTCAGRDKKKYKEYFLRVLREFIKSKKPEVSIVYLACYLNESKGHLPEGEYLGKTTKSPQFHAEIDYLYSCLRLYGIKPPEPVQKKSEHYMCPTSHKSAFERLIFVEKNAVKLAQLLVKLTRPTPVDVDHLGFRKTETFQGKHGTMLVPHSSGGGPNRTLGKTWGKTGFSNL